MTETLAAENSGNTATVEYWDTTKGAKKVWMLAFF